MSKGHAKTRRIGGSILPKSTRGRRLLWFDSPSSFFLDLTIDQLSIPLRSVQHSIYTNRPWISPSTLLIVTPDSFVSPLHQEEHSDATAALPGMQGALADLQRRHLRPRRKDLKSNTTKKRTTHIRVFTMSQSVKQYFVCRESKLLQLNFPDTDNSRNEHLPLFAFPHAVVPQAVVPHVQNPKACVGSASRAPKLP